MAVALIDLWTVQGIFHAASARFLAQPIFVDLGKTQLLSIFILVACFVAGRILSRGPRLERTVLLGIALSAFFVSQVRLVHSNYLNNGFQRRTSLVVSKWMIEGNLSARRFSGKKVLPLLVADYMPHAKLFLYDRTEYSRELLSWSGRNPDDTFIVGGYQSSIDETVKKASLAHPHTIYDGLYVAMPLSTYETERQVYMMHDGLIDYLIPGSWLNSRHE